MQDFKLSILIYFKIKVGRLIVTFIKINKERQT